MSTGSGESAMMGVRVAGDFLPRSLPNPVQVPNTETAILTCPVGGRYKIDSILLCESSGNARTVTIRKYASALGNTAANNLFTALSLAANETKQIDFPEGFYLTNGQILAALASAATSVNIDVSYEVEY